MIKRISYVALMALLIFTACQKKAENVESASADSDEWKAMDDFHMVMADMYHPFKDSANLEPARTGLVSFEAAVNTFADAPLPAKVDTDEVKASFASLKTDVEAMKSATDDATFGTALESAHTHFHEIMEAWHGGGGHEHHKH
jgi:hypothetical protein